MTALNNRLLLTLALVLLIAAHADPSTPHPAQSSGSPQAQAKIGNAAHIQPLRPNFRFPYGDTLRYEGEWRFITAGVATLVIEQSGSQNHISATADSSGVVSLLYRIQDRFNSYTDAKTLCTYKLMKHTEEGLRRRDTVVTYDYTRGKAVLEERNLKDGHQNRAENDVPGCVTDLLSGILYVASLPLQVGASYTFPLNDGGKTVTVQAHVEGTEEIKTPAGTFKTLRVGPEGDSGALLKNKGRIWIWYSDDERHLPIQMRAKVLWGTVTVYLVSIGK